jgi:deoxyribodipyrimidine photo-lyase
MSVIHWFRRDLRLSDNTALHQACTSGQPVIPLFVFDTNLLKSERIGASRLKFLLDSLKSLDESLQELGTGLLIRRGKPIEVLREIITEKSVKALYFNRDYSPYANKRDEKIEQALGIPVYISDDALLLPPETVLKADGSPYLVFTPYWKKWQEKEKASVSQLELHQGHFEMLESRAILTMQDLGFAEIASLAPASEAYALQRLSAFIENDIEDYAEKRNHLAISPYNTEHPEGSSYLSPYLRFGLLSPRQAYWSAQKAYENTENADAQGSIKSWISELAWREFYAQILQHFPHVLKRDFVDSYLTLKWQNDAQDLKAWQLGMTGYPIVDAAMRQLNTSGWMPNRARMIVASFLTKHLLVHWRYGELYFIQRLIDGDTASNNGGWQWAAGTGTDAQPYFRIFNPVSQSKKFASPDYLRYWLPELKDVPDNYIHDPWEMDEPPQNYPSPIVDHREARERALEVFRQARGEA